jgi:SNF family Na+-dependent transporter
MGLFGLLLLVLITLSVIGLGWEVFSSGVIDGFEKAVDISMPIVKNLTHEAKEYTNDINQLRTS